MKEVEIKFRVADIAALEEKLRAAGFKLKTARTHEFNILYDLADGGLRKRGESEDTAEEIAARTVNKERARSGEAKQASRSSTRDISSGRRGGLRSHRGPGGRTKEQLYNEARRKNVKGRSKMTKAQLERAVGR